MTQSPHNNAEATNNAELPNCLRGETKVKAMQKYAFPMVNIHFDAFSLLSSCFNHEPSGFLSKIG